MNKYKSITTICILMIILQSCSQILEPISLKSDEDLIDFQEEFNIRIEALTFKKAKLISSAPYERRLKLTGSGSIAKVANETNFLNTRIPIEEKDSDYTLGVGDKLEFTLLSEFTNTEPQWPIKSKNSEYLLGIGDQLTFTQFNDTNNLSVTLDDNGKILNSERDDDALLITTGIIGSNGNILLLGMGNIKAIDRTLNDVQTEVRNIIIRNGYSPNFQLEITGFKSKKAYLTTKIDDTNLEGKIIPINNLPITLKEICLNAGLSEAMRNLAVVSLTRNGQSYQFTAKQLFNLDVVDIYIRNKDQIEIEIISNSRISATSVVDANGTILLPKLGRLNAQDLTLKELQYEVRNLLKIIKLMPNFQLELSKSANKKAYLIRKDIKSKVVDLSNKKITLKELILKNEMATIPTNGLTIVKLRRDKQKFQITAEQLLSIDTPDVWIKDNDIIELEVLEYKPGQIYALSGSDNAQIIEINPSNRETLADVLFVSGGALGNSLARRSEIYLLRGRSPSFAYHLDARNVSRILVAAKTELRPDDIIFVADRPIISFARVLNEITPLRRLLRDIQNNDIP